MPERQESIMRSAAQERQDPFTRFDHKPFILLTTFRRDGTPIPTPVDAYHVHEGLFFITDPCTGKAKRLRRNPHVLVCPSTVRGAPVGPTIHARVRRLSEREAAAALEVFVKIRPVAFRLTVARYRLSHRQMAVYEILPSHTTRLVA
jgi:PPOX class probable F420-dependent enzyme